MTRTLASIPLCLLSVVLLAACSRTDTAAPVTDVPATDARTAMQGAAPAATGIATDAYRFRIGDLEAVALRDGSIEAANDGESFVVDRPTAEVAALLSAAGAPTDVLRLDIQPLLVRAGGRVLLFDTGAAGVSFARGGQLGAALQAAGVAPTSVTDIFISHRHDDHLGGLRAADGTLAFPNARIHMTAREWADLQASEDAATLVAAISPQVEAFEPGADLIPGMVSAVIADGHTPGHSAYRIGAGEDSLLYIGDVMHHFVVSVRRPGWTIAYDHDVPQARARREAFLQREAEAGTRIHAVHFPFPGLGRFEAEGDGYVWEAEVPAAR